jgi:hypothetical protein
LPRLQPATIFAALKIFAVSFRLENRPEQNNAIFKIIVSSIFFIDFFSQSVHRNFDLPWRQLAGIEARKRCTSNSACPYVNSITYQKTRKNDRAGKETGPAARRPMPGLVSKDQQY